MLATSSAAAKPFPAALAFLLLLAGLSPTQALGGGPFTAGIISGQGFQRWNPAQPVPYSIDPGAFGTNQNNAAGVALVEESFQRWEDVSTASLTTQNVGPLPADVTAANFNNFDGAPNEPVSIVFDLDGSIIDSVFGDGASDNTLGFASPRFPNAEGFYTSGVIVLNGRRSGRFGFDQTVTHEVGHLLGLDHTQINRRFESPPSAQRQFVPLMYPLALPNQGPEPELDDAAWFSFIYPQPGFSDTVGSIRGQVFRPNGLPMLSGHVTAVQVTEEAGGLVLSDNQLVGGAVDYLLSSDGSFLLPGLPPGDYLVFIEPIDTRFVAGSSVGPQDESTSRQDDYPRDFFNGDGESADDDPLEALVVTVEAGRTVEDIDFIVNAPPQSDAEVIPVSLGDDDAEVFDFPEGFAFPFQGRVFGQMIIHSDGNICLNDGDAASTPRSAGRLVFGPPRIAPFFTDLNPRAGGTVQVVVLEDALRVEWIDVPEFTPGGPNPPGNTFSATLRSTGEIQFDYGDLSVTPDPFDEDRLAAVGVAPGFFSDQIPQFATDLSAAGGPIPFDQVAVVEDFRVGTGGIDLEGQQVVFRPETQTFVFPFLQADEVNFTGFATANVSGGGAALTLENFNSDGSSADLPTNPSIRGVLDGFQFAQVGNELFDVPAQSPQSGWVRMISNQPELASFFQFGNGLSATPLTQLDGGVAIRQDQIGDVIFFSRVLQGPVFLSPGAQVEAETVFSIINPSDQEIEIEATYFNTVGAMLFNPVTRVIPPRGSIRESFPQLFGNAPPIMDGYVRVELLQGSQVTGFQLIRLPDSVFGINAFRPGQVDTIYSAQLANGGAGGAFSFTNLNLVNTSNQQVLVTI
ncbi:MAG TPA: hypothetical protein VLU25_12755, partial [Acidobacteriota bacterium]|nr:hypothetical protein [Acidobacteriota bacterium]